MFITIIIFTSAQKIKSKGEINIVSQTDSGSIYYKKVFINQENVFINDKNVFSCPEGSECTIFFFRRKKILVDISNYKNYSSSPDAFVFRENAVVIDIEDLTLYYTKKLKGIHRNQIIDISDKGVKIKKPDRRGSFVRICW